MMKAPRVVSAICVCFLILSFGVPPAHAQCEIQSVKFLGSADTRAAYAVEVVGSYAYVGDWEGLKVIDISNPSSPQVVGSVGTPQSISNLIVSGQYAYVTSWESFFGVINISDPSNPFIAGSLFGFGGKGLELFGDYVYIANAYILQVISVSTPAHPVILETIELKDYTRDVEVADNYAYLAGQRYVTVLDISSPADPVEVATAPTLYYAEEIVIEGCNAFLATWGGLEVFDISTPTSPCRIGSLDLGFSNWIEVNSQYAYLDGMSIVDISTPSAPFLINYSFPGYAGESAGFVWTGVYDIAFSGNLGYAACAPYLWGEGFGKLQVLDLSTSSALPKLHEISATGANGVAVAGSLAYVTRCQEEDALDIIDFSNLSSPQVVGSVPLPYSAIDIEVSGSYAFVVGDAFVVVDTSEPTNPVAQASLLSWGIDLALSWNLALVANGITLDIIDITDPTSPHILHSLATLHSPQGVAVSGQYAYVADWAGLEIVDISNPAAPVIVGSVVDYGALATRVAVSGNYAYLLDCNPDRGLVVVDVSNPAAPAIVARTHTLGSIVSDIEISGSYAYVSASEGLALLIYDIQDPTAPTLAAKIDKSDGTDWGSPAGGIAISDSLAFLARNDLEIFHLCALSGGAPAISLSPASLSLTMNQGTSASETIEVWNSGAGALSYFISASASVGLGFNPYANGFTWLLPRPFSGGSVGEHDSIELTFHSSYLPPGEHTVDIIIADLNASNSPQTIPVSLTVLPVYHTLVAAASPPEAGSVNGGGTYTYEQEAVIEAVPNIGWKFDHWEGEGISGRTSNPISLWMNIDRNVTAVFAPDPLTQISLSSPSDGDTISSPPTFAWTYDGGINNAFAVDASLTADFSSYWSTYENGHQLISATSWTMPQSVWNKLPSGKTVYWRVRGVDLGRQPRSIVTSAETSILIPK
jgi:hypothetical protein